MVSLVQLLAPYCVCKSYPQWWCFVYSSCSCSHSNLTPLYSHQMLCLGLLDCIECVTMSACFLVLCGLHFRLWGFYFLSVLLCFCLVSSIFLTQFRMPLSALWYYVSSVLEFDYVRTYWGFMNGSTVLWSSVLLLYCTLVPLYSGSTHLSLVYFPSFIKALAPQPATSCIWALAPQSVNGCIESLAPQLVVSCIEVYQVVVSVWFSCRRLFCIYAECLRISSLYRSSYSLSIGFPSLCFSVRWVQF